MAKLLLLPGSFVVDYCAPSGVEVGPTPVLCLAQAENFASFGILVGTVIVARPLGHDEAPTDNSFCIVRARGRRRLKRVNFTDGGLQLSDDTGTEAFAYEEIYFEAVALYACSCDLLGSPCAPVLLSAATGLEIFRQKTGVLRWETDALGYLQITDEIREWLLFVGAKPEEWEGWGWAKFLHPEDAEAFTARWRESLETGGPYINQGRMFFGGAWVYMASSANPVRDISGRIVGWKGFLHLEAIEERQAS